MSSIVELLSTPSMWQVLLSIIFVNILLSGDNAIVISLATRNLPPGQQRQAIFWGCAAAIVFRVVFIFVSVQILAMPFVRIVGSFLLLYIGIQLLAESEDYVPRTRRHHSKLWGTIRRFFALDKGTRGDEIKGHSKIWGAIRTIVAADIVMSLDNIVAVSAAAEKAPANARLTILFIGLGISIPIILFASTTLIKLIHRFPVIIFLGAGFLGFLAGELLSEDPAIRAAVKPGPPSLMFEAVGAAIVLFVGTVLGME
jgi:YjbE family integral membrane protein